ncbi:hypothetical protein [Chryseobacterium sp.]|uniref:hypothetical protein n=1 Tax=Chryseobacterium sp. TaxID=1871047 RepID=UPI0011C9904D|nr:hypothetical protein [Chryseobacterium sp.]TXF79196.1 hypothetical protein FUA25_02035 [Chryseobacterium sp.]
MKKIKQILAVALLFSVQLFFAQQLQESLDWINSKRIEGFDYFSTGLSQDPENRLQITSDKIRIESKDATKYTWFDWNTINDMRVNDEVEGKYVLYIVSNYIYEGLPLYIGIHFKSKDLRTRFSNAVEHIAKLKGGKGLIYNNYDTSKSSAVIWLRARGIDIFEGDNKLRLEITEDRIRKYYLKSTESISINWRDVKEIKSELYEKNKKYKHVTIVGPTDAAGNLTTISFYIYQGMADEYVKALNSLAYKNGAQLVKEDLF